MAESPLLKDLYAQYKDQGVVVIGISLDEDVKPLREMVTTKRLAWPQILDADKSIRKLYNVKGTPTYYLFDREGKIAAKDVPSFKRLSAALADLFKQ